MTSPIARCRTARLLTCVHAHACALVQALTRLAHDPVSAWGSGRIAFACGNGGGHLDLLTALLDAGESPELTGPLRGKMAGIIGVCDVLRRFKRLGSERDFVFCMAYGARSPAITGAAMNGNLVAIRLLIDRGADINNVGRNPTRFTALHHAAVGGHVDAVVMLLAAGARTDLKDFRGRTPADVAKRTGNTEIQLIIGAAAEQCAPVGSRAVAPPADMVVEDLSAPAEK